MMSAPLLITNTTLVMTGSMKSCSRAFSSGKKAKSIQNALTAHKPVRPKIVVGPMVTTGCWKYFLIQKMTSMRKCLSGWAESTSHRNLHPKKLNLITQRSVGNWLFQKVNDFLGYTATRSR